MLTRSQTRMNSNVSIPKNTVMPMPKPESKTHQVATHQRMITRSQARQVEEDEAEVITLHVNPSKNRRIIKDDVVVETPTLRRSSRINFDKASVAWRSNKRSVGNGQFEYM